MSAGPLDTYLQALERALYDRGHPAARFVDEARDHLLDIVDEGLRRGLARELAEREAVERFGPPDVIAAQAAPARSRSMARLNVAVDMVAGHWRWVTAATAAAALLTGAGSYYWLPAHYRAQSVIAVGNAASMEGLRSISEAVLSDPRLEGMTREFGLGDAAAQVRRRISVEVAGTGPEQFSVSFAAADPQVARRVTERLAAMFIEANLQQATRSRGDAAARTVFKIIQPAHTPMQGHTPGVATATVSGAFAGLALSVAALVWRKRRR